MSKPAEPGIQCPKCGCRHFEVRNTVPKRNGTIVRYRVCRHCGKVVTTREAPVGKCYP